MKLIGKIKKEGEHVMKDMMDMLDVKIQNN